MDCSLQETLRFEGVKHIARALAGFVVILNAINWVLRHGVCVCCRAHIRTCKWIGWLVGSHLQASIRSDKLYPIIAGQRKCWCIGVEALSAFHMLVFWSGIFAAVCYFWKLTVFIGKVEHTLAKIKQVSSQATHSSS